VGHAVTGPGAVPASARLLAVVARWTLRPVLALVVVRVGVEVVGQVVMASVLAPVILVWGLGRWAAMERRLDERCRATSVMGPRAYGRVDQVGEHVAFARALVAVSARYLQACEDQADAHNGWGSSREGWR
jgi:hypothetical protein